MKLSSALAGLAKVGAAPKKKAPTRKELVKALAKKMREADDDDKTADVLEALIELSRSPED